MSFPGQQPSLRPRRQPDRGPGGAFREVRDPEGDADDFQRRRGEPPRIMALDAVPFIGTRTRGFPS